MGLRGSRMDISYTWMPRETRPGSDRPRARRGLLLLLLSALVRRVNCRHISCSRLAERVKPNNKQRAVLLLLLLRALSSGRIEKGRERVRERDKHKQTFFT